MENVIRLRCRLFFPAVLKKQSWKSSCYLYWAWSSAQGTNTFSVIIFFLLPSASHLVFSYIQVTFAPWNWEDITPSSASLHTDAAKGWTALSSELHLTPAAKADIFLYLVANFWGDTLSGNYRPYVRTTRRLCIKNQTFPPQLSGENRTGSVSFMHRVYEVTIHCKNKSVIGVMCVGDVWWPSWC